MWERWVTTTCKAESYAWWRWIFDFAFFTRLLRKFTVTTATRLAVHGYTVYNICFMFFAISTINSRTVLTFTANSLLKTLSIWMTRAIVQATAFFLPSNFDCFRLSHLMVTLLIRMTACLMVTKQLFLSLVISRLFPLTVYLQFFAFIYFVTWFLAVMASDESSWHRWLTTSFSTPTICPLIPIELWIIFRHWQPFRMIDENRSHHPLNLF